MAGGENFQPEAKVENNEAQKEALEMAQRLCADYHAELDSTKDYCDNKAIQIAGKLLPQFLEIKQDLLPDPVKLVVEHRIAYLRFADSLKGGPIGDFLSSIRIESVVVNSPADFYRSVKENDKFKALTALDLLQVVSALEVGIRSIQPIRNANVGWGSQAEALLKPAGLASGDIRIDDEEAVNNLDLLFAKIQPFAHYAMDQKMKGN